MFPGQVPNFEKCKDETESVLWNKEKIRSRFQEAVDWGKKHNVQIVLGEFGICRDISGSKEYLEAVAEVCMEFRLSGFIFSFRDSFWDAMDYEFGIDGRNFIRLLPAQNELIEAIQRQIQKFRTLQI